MRRPLVVLLSAFAVIATGVAIWAEWNLSIAVPAAVIAIICASLLFVEPWANRTPSPFVQSRLPSSGAGGSLRRALTSGRFGREAIVDTLDRLERAGPNPSLSARRPEEADRILRMPEGEFREYLRGRLDRLERES